jgi:hypothetical protein
MAIVKHLAIVIATAALVLRIPKAVAIGALVVFWVVVKPPFVALQAFCTNVPFPSPMNVLTARSQRTAQLVCSVPTVDTVRLAILRFLHV